MRSRCSFVSPVEYLPKSVVRATTPARVVSSRSPPSRLHLLTTPSRQPAQTRRPRSFSKARSIDPSGRRPGRWIESRAPNRLSDAAKPGKAKEKGPRTARPVGASIQPGSGRCGFRRSLVARESDEVDRLSRLFLSPPGPRRKEENDRWTPGRRGRRRRLANGGPSQPPAAIYNSQPNCLSTV